MKTILTLICVSMFACAVTPLSRESKAAEPTAQASPTGGVSFIAIDKTYVASPRTAPAAVLLEEKELAAAPPFRAVGVLQLEGKETQRLSDFYQAAAEAGAAVGCDVIYQRDAFELGTRTAKPVLPQTVDGSMGAFIRNSGREWHRNDRALWQFLCGVTGASDREQQQNLRAATSLAVELRRKALGNFEPCEAFTPLGSHIRQTDVCAKAPAHRAVAAASATPPFCGDPATSLQHCL